MKKLFIFILGIILFSCTTATDAKTIPDEAIRFRVIANSNSKEDQALKLKVKEETEKYIYNVLKDSKDITEARYNMAKNVDNVETVVKDVLAKENSNETYKVNFGQNYFPNKEYKGITYDEGNYESLVITLGQGLGENWWCVLFPPLCLLEAEEHTEVEYKFFVEELINKYF